MRSTKDVRVVVLTEYWSKEYKREDGTVVPEGWRKSMGWPRRASQRPDGNINDFSQGAFKAYRECTLYQALTVRAQSPAYFVGYMPNTIHLRLRKDALSPLFSGFTEDGGGVYMHLALFDVDNHTDDADLDEWFNAELDKISALQDIHPGTIVYRSRRGYRIISLLPSPVKLTTSDDSRQWDRTYTAWCNYLKRKFDIKADVLLDWTRYQAVPHTKKDRNEPALELEVFGNVEEIGSWQPELIDTDFPPEKIVGSYDGANFEGTCQLLALVQLAGLRCEVTEYKDVYDICCPNWTSHSPDSRGLQDYPSKTVLYTNGPIGKIECKSSNCQASHPDRNRSYFRHFNPQDVLDTAPKPPVDVWDHDVHALATYRNELCSKVSIDDYLDGKVSLDDTWQTYQTACSMQARIKRKNDSAH